MASLEQHKADCVKYLGAPFEDVHKWIDEFFSKYGPSHRRFRHHREGVQEARQLFGEAGAKAAIVHILRDCRNIPRKKDYESGQADNLGLKSEWPVTAYIGYTEEAFSALVKYTLEGPMGVILWAFFKTQFDLQITLRGLSRLTPDQQAEYLTQWEQTSHIRASLPPLPDKQPEIREPESDDVRKYFEAFKATVVFKNTEAQFGNAKLAIVSVQDLIATLALIDFAYLEELKATLIGSASIDIARFGIPDNFNVNMRSMQDPSGRSLTFVSSEKALTMSQAIVQHIPGSGVEVKFLVTTIPQLILVSRIQNRLYIRNGMHRTYLLASLGVKQIPCMLIDEPQIPVLSGSYPTFSPSALDVPRPPLLMDFFEPSLVTKIPMVVTGKVLRITGEEFVIPFD